MKIFNRAMFLLGIISFSVGCGSSDSDPKYSAEGGVEETDEKQDWVDGPSRRFSEREFLTAVGRGNTRKACENDAYAALAKRFEASVRQESTDTMTHFSRVSQESSERVEGMDINTLTRVSTDYVLHGARIASRYRESEESFHCLVVLERRSATGRLVDEIGRLDAEIDAEVAAGDAADSPTRKFMKYRHAMELMQQRQALNAELQIVAESGRGRSSQVSWNDLVAKFSQARSNVKIGLVLTGKEKETVQTCLAGELLNRGIEILENTSDVDLMVHGDLRYQNAGTVKNAVMVRATVNLRLTDAQDGNTVAAMTETLKAGRTDWNTSMQLVVVKLCHQTAPKLVAKINEALSR